MIIGACKNFSKFHISIIKIRRFSRELRSLFLIPSWQFFSSNTCLICQKQIDLSQCFLSPLKVRFTLTRQDSFTLSIKIRQHFLCHSLLRRRVYQKRKRIEQLFFFFCLKCRTFRIQMTSFLPTVPEILHPEGIQTLLFPMIIAALPKCYFTCILLEMYRLGTLLKFGVVICRIRWGKGDFLRTFLKTSPLFRKRELLNYYLFKIQSPTGIYIFESIL